jgi:lipopolysaccharide transport system ATP-binding protein
MKSEDNSRPDNEVLVRVEGVSKKFCRSLKKSLWYGVCDIAGELSPFGSRSRLAGSGLRVAGNGTDGETSELATSDSLLVTSPSLRDGEFWAVNNVSFELRRGECLGLIGHNGAGKTTLLKMLNGLIKPDAGKITMRGRVGALIALGAGFNPILTGRENIYINGSVLGLSKKEIDKRIDEIIEFAEIGDFIDTPVQNYSSGMTVRLGFAIASSLSPDVLILDEVLAVGDIGFVIKCLNRVRQLSASAAVILVSHQMQNISSFCSRVLFMERGQAIVDTNEPAEAIDRYYTLVEAGYSQAGTGGVTIYACNVHPYAESISHKSDVELKIVQGTPGSVRIDFEVHSGVSGSEVQVNIMDQSGSPVVCIPVMASETERCVFPVGRHAVEIPLGALELNAGKYHLTLLFHDPFRDLILCRTQGLGVFRVVASHSHWARIVRPALVVASSS